LINIKIANKDSVIGKSISKVSNKHKPYFTTDENGVIISYNRKVCVDRMELKAKLDKSILSNLLIQLLGRYRMREVVAKLKNGFVRTIYQFDLSKAEGVFIEIIPHEKTNLKIQLQSKFTNNHRNNNPRMLAILNEYPLFITRVDIATDYTTPFNNSAVLKRHGNQAQKNFDTYSWVGSTGNRNKTAINSHYDRSKKVEGFGLNRHINRFEVKMYFKEGDNMSLANINHSLIAERLKKEIFIPCLQYSYFHERTVGTTKGIQLYTDLIKQAKAVDNENTVRLMLDNQSAWRTHRKHFKACRDDVEQAYLDKKNVIYDFLLPKESLESMVGGLRLHSNYW